jgi:hypothetical protein
MNNITTYKQLLTKKQLLEVELASKKIVVQRDFDELKNKLLPLQKLAATAGQFTHRDRSNPLLNIGLDAGVNFLLRNVLFRRAGFITRLIAPALVKNYLSNAIPKKHNLFSNIIDLFKSGAHNYGQAKINLNGENSKQLR